MSTLVFRVGSVLLGLCLIVTMLVVVPSAAASVAFTTFVSSTDLNNLLNNTATIGFAYAGDEFIGSVYFGPNNNQLYSSNLNGNGLALFGQPITGASGEIYVTSSLGLGNFPSRDVYAADNNSIMHFTHDGSSQNIFTTLPGCACTVRGMLFDDVGSFHNNMLVTTTTGQIFSVKSTGAATQIANLGQDSEGMAIATSAFGPYAGFLLVGSEGTGQIHAINPVTGAVTLLSFNIPGAEMLSSVPLNLGHGGPLEGFYAANYAVDIIHADASQFSGLQGDLVVTGESDHQMSDIHWNGSSFVVTDIGMFPDQPEDGIFVTESIINPTPEPSTLLMFGTALVGVAGRMIRKKLS